MSSKALTLKRIEEIVAPRPEEKQYTEDELRECEEVLIAYAEKLAKEGNPAAGPLVSELKKLEDRELIMEVTLEESKSAFALKNFAKAKTSLVLARTNANAGAYVSTKMQVNWLILLSKFT
ncbi:unnamed protein product [Strongylus vulgaris]|uniref:Uncharacterized protein n=1 Tax=Strongylus vulgaris TaxID=40348 RepID=A0A3P7J2D8_STRVU|nr:unnamed protein product [Strongylus vulgaris]